MIKRYISYLSVLLFLAACSPKQARETSDKLPDIFPDYAFVTVPCNIAPPNFVVEGAEYVRADFAVNGVELFTATGTPNVNVPDDEWQKAMKSYKGKQLTVTVSVWDKAHPGGVVYKPFTIEIAPDEIDPWIAYRLIEPGYELWKQMGIYQRNLTSFEEKEVVTNRQNQNGCVNCHSFQSYSPKNMMFHARGKNGCTVLVKDNRPQRLDLKNMTPNKNGTYPMWHPSGNYIVFSSNETKQSFYNHSRDKVEVYDLASDLIIYDNRHNRVLTDPRFMTDSLWETFPAFSPDGKSLYFCRAEAKKMPMEYKKLKYGLYRVSFDPATGKLGKEIETIYDPAVMGGSVSFPRISPDGKYLLYTEAACATFPIWHKEADLKMVRLSDGQPMDTRTINSDDVESYHSWSSNGRWVLFSSRRIDGRYTRLFIAWFDKNGKFHKPFLLPQKDARENTLRLKSYNIPEFIKGEVQLDKDQVAKLFN